MYFADFTSLPLNRCGEEGHMRRDCTNEEQTYTYTNEEGETKEMYVPQADGDASELYSAGIASGINFDKYDSIPVSVTGDNKPSAIKSFTGAGLRPILVENVTKSGYKKPTPVQKNGIPIIMAGRDMMACAQVFNTYFFSSTTSYNCLDWLWQDCRIPLTHSTPTDRRGRRLRSWTSMHCRNPN